MAIAQSLQDTTIRKNLPQRFLAAALNIRLLKNVTTESENAFPNKGFNQIHQDVQTKRGGWSSWVKNINKVFRQSTGYLETARGVLTESEHYIKKIGFQTGLLLEPMRTTSKKAKSLLKKLEDAKLYDQTQAAQVCTLNLATESLTSSSTSVVISNQVKRPNALTTVEQVINLTEKLNQLIYDNPSEQTGVRTLDKNDAQIAFYLRDSIYGLVKQFNDLKKDPSYLTPELQEKLKNNKDILSNAWDFANWSPNLKAAIGLP